MIRLFLNSSIANAFEFGIGLLLTTDASQMRRHFRGATETDMDG